MKARVAFKWTSSCEHKRCAQEHDDSVAKQERYVQVHKKPSVNTTLLLQVHIKQLDPHVMHSSEVMGFQNIHVAFK